MILLENRDVLWLRVESLMLAREIEPPPADIVSVKPISCPPIPLLCVLHEMLSSSGIVGGGGGSSPSSPDEKRTFRACMYQSQGENFICNMLNNYISLMTYLGLMDH